MTGTTGSRALCHVQSQVASRITLMSSHTWKKRRSFSNMVLAVLAESLALARLYSYQMIQHTPLRFQTVDVTCCIVPFNFSLSLPLSLSTIVFSHIFAFTLWPFGPEYLLLVLSVSSLRTLSFSCYSTLTYMAIQSPGPGRLDYFRSVDSRCTRMKCAVLQSQTVSLRINMD